MSTQRIDLSKMNLGVIEAILATAQAAPKETVEGEEKQAVPDEFEIRRKLFFQA
jgi:hypothetical protein